MPFYCVLNNWHNVIVDPFCNFLSPCIVAHSTDTHNSSTVKNKINRYAFSGGQPTLEEHKKLGGDPDIDVSFQYLRMIFEPDDKKLKKIYDDYKKGLMSTGELKSYTIDKLNSFLKVHQTKRKRAKRLIDKYIYKM